MSERDPFDVAREVWPELEWEDHESGPYVNGPLHLGVKRVPSGGWFVTVSLECGAKRLASARNAELRIALTEARRLTLERPETAAVLCRATVEVDDE